MGRIKKKTPVISGTSHVIDSSGQGDFHNSKRYVIWHFEEDMFLNANLTNPEVSDPRDPPKIQVNQIVFVDDPTKCMFFDQINICAQVKDFVEKMLPGYSKRDDRLKLLILKDGDIKDRLQILRQLQNTDLKFNMMAKGKKL